MPDNPKQTGKPDRDRVSAEQDHEVKYLMEKTGKSKAEVVAAIKKHGPMRVAIEAALKKK